MARLVITRKVLPVILAVLCSSTINADIELSWESVLTTELEPNSTAIYSIDQQGQDIAVRIVRNDSVVSTQDGPDQAFGREIIVFENNSTARQEYELQLAALTRGMSLDFELVRLPNPAAEDIEVAHRLSSAHQNWFTGVSAGATLNDLRMVLDDHRDHRLAPLAELSYANALLRSGDFKTAIQFIYALLEKNTGRTDCAYSEGGSASNDFLALLESAEFELAAQQVHTLQNCQLTTGRWPDKDQLELFWLLADSLRQAGYLEVAAEAISVAAQKLSNTQQLLSLNDRERKWIRANISISQGTILILLGAKLGNDELKIEGGELFRKEYRNYVEDPDLFTRARLIDSLAAFYIFFSGRTNSTSQELLDRAEDIYNQSGDRSLIGAMRNNQAYAELGKGNLANALELYLESMDILASSKHVEGRAHVRARLGYIYYVLGNYSESISRYREANDIYESDLRLEQKLINNKLEFAGVLREVNQPQDALDQLRQTSGILQTSEVAGIEDRIRLQTQLALTHLELGELAEAEISAENLEALLASVDSIEGRIGMGSPIRLQYQLELAILNARLAIARNRFESAITHVSNAVALILEDEPENSEPRSGAGSPTIREPLQYLELSYLKLVAYEALGLTEKLLQEGEPTLDLIEAIRSDIDLANSAGQWLARTARIRDILIATHIARFEQSGDDDSLAGAFELIELAKARSLRDSRRGLSDDNVDPDMRSASDQLNLDSQALINAELAGAPTELIDDLKARLDRSQERYARESLSGARATHSLSGIDIFELQNQLDADAIGLIFTIAEAEGFLIAVSGSSGIAVRRLPGKFALKSRIDTALQEIGDDNGRSQLRANRELAMQLLPPDIIADHQQIIIEADEDLNRLSFATLEHIQSPDVAREIIHTPSFSELFSSDTPQLAIPAERDSIAIFANPSVTLNTQLSSTEEVQTQRTSLIDLPFTLREAQVIEQKYAAEERVSFIQAEATIANLTSDRTRNARILHIASHGFASKTDSEFLGLALAENSRTGESGLLTAHQISQLRFSNELVVIGACETAVGETVRGEGILSISRAFLANGASATLSTLWPVQDRANFEFMNHFYSALVETGLSPSQALTYAQSKFREPGSRYNSPKHWGAYVLQKIHAPESRLEH